MVKVHRALFLLPSSAVYVMLLSPIGSRTGGTSAGMTVTVGWNPELSTAAGTLHSTRPTLSSGAVSTWMLAGQTISGAVTSTRHNSNLEQTEQSYTVEQAPRLVVFESGLELRSAVEYNSVELRRDLFIRDLDSADAGLATSLYCLLTVVPIMAERTDIYNVSP